MAAESARPEPAQSSARGDDTRHRLVDAALHIFGSYGFEGASTRAVADRAGANLASIPYYFGSKEGLYRAVAQSIVEDGSREMLPIIQRIDESLVGKHLDRESALTLLHELLDTFSTMVIGSRRALSWSRFIMREQLQPGSAFEILFEGLMRRIGQTFVKILAYLTGNSTTDPRIAVLAQMVLGQALIFHNCGESVLRQLAWKEFSADKVSLIQAVLRDNVDLILAAPRFKRASTVARKPRRKGSRHE